MNQGYVSEHDEEDPIRHDRFRHSGTDSTVRGQVTGAKPEDGDQSDTIGGKCESVMGRRVVRKGVSKRVFERRSYQLVAS